MMKMHFLLKLTCVAGVFFYGGMNFVSAQAPAPVEVDDSNTNTSTSAYWTYSSGSSGSATITWNSSTSTSAQGANGNTFKSTPKIATFNSVPKAYLWAVLPESGVYEVQMRWPDPTQVAPKTDPAKIGIQVNYISSGLPVTGTYTGINQVPVSKTWFKVGLFNFQKSNSPQNLVTINGIPGSRAFVDAVRFIKVEPAVYYNINSTTIDFKSSFPLYRQGSGAWGGRGNIWTVNKSDASVMTTSNRDAGMLLHTPVPYKTKYRVYIKYPNILVTNHTTGANNRATSVSVSVCSDNNGANPLTPIGSSNTQVDESVPLNTTAPGDWVWIGDYNVTSLTPSVIITNKDLRGGDQCLVQEVKFDAITDSSYVADIGTKYFSNGTYLQNNTGINGWQVIANTPLRTSPGFGTDRAFTYLNPFTNKKNTYPNAGAINFSLKPTLNGRFGIYVYVSSESGDTAKNISVGTAVISRGTGTSAQSFQIRPGYWNAVGGVSSPITFTGAETINIGIYPNYSSVPGGSISALNIDAVRLVPLSIVDGTNGTANGIDDAVEQGLYQKVLTSSDLVSQAANGMTIGDALNLSLDPRTNDTDGDGIPDDWELTNGLNPYSPDDLGTTDTDGDGIPDAWEISMGLNPNDASDASLDPDGSGETWLERFLNGQTAQQPISRPAAVRAIGEKAEGNTTLFSQLVADDFAGVNVWADKRGLAGHPSFTSQSIPYYMADQLNGHALLKFDGNSQFLRLAPGYQLPMSKIGNFAMFIVAKNDDSNGNTAAIISNGKDGSSSSGWIMRYSASGSGIAYANASDDNKVSVKPAPNTTKWHVIEVRRQMQSSGGKADFRIGIDGSFSDSASYTPAIPTSANTYIGAIDSDTQINGVQPGKFLKGSIAEILMYTGSNVDRGAIYNRFLTRYGLPIQNKAPVVRVTIKVNDVLQTSPVIIDEGTQLSVHLSASDDDGIGVINKLALAYKKGTKSITVNKAPNGSNSSDFMWKPQAKQGGETNGDYIITGSAFDDFEGTPNANSLGMSPSITVKVRNKAPESQHDDQGQEINQFSIVTSETKLQLDSTITDHGQDAHLKWLWRIVQQPTASAAKIVQATASKPLVIFKQPGSYAFTCTATDASTSVKLVEVDVTVTQLFKTLSISPSKHPGFLSRTPNSTTLFKAKYKDQFKHTGFAAGTVRWSVNGGGVIGADGRFVAGSSLTVGSPLIVTAVWEDPNSANHTFNLTATQKFKIENQDSDPAIDSDGDGMPDGWEISHGLNPQVDDGESPYVNNGSANGLSNSEQYLTELLNIGDQGGAFSSGINGDDDGDNIPNVLELSFGTSPFDPDTDHDGKNDLIDQFPFDSNVKTPTPGGKPIITITAPANLVP